MKATLSIDYLKHYGFDTVEKVVAMVFKKHYKGDWSKANIIAKIDEKNVTYELKN